MILNRENYELMAIDYIEGSLSSSEKEQFESFLAQNPDITKELEGFREAFISSDSSVNCPFKESLLKVFPEEGSAVSPTNFDMFAVAYLENDLTQAQKSQFDAFLVKNPTFGEEFKLLCATKLSQEEISFPNKSVLRRRNPRLIRLAGISTVAAAAAIAFLFFIGPLTNIEEQPVAVVDVDEIASEITPVKKEEEIKQPVQPRKETPSLKLIKSNKAPMPVSTFKKQEPPKNQNTTSRKEAQESRKIAGINLKDAARLEIKSQRDRIRPVSVDPIEPNRSSFSVAALARYEYQRVSKMAEEEDQLILSLATNGIKELNRITGSDMQLMASKDDKGDLSGIRFNSRFLKVTAPIQSEEE